MGRRKDGDSSKHRHRPKRDRKPKKDLLDGGSALVNGELPWWLQSGRHPYYSGRGGQIRLF
jgi:hypothetical protein